MLFTRNIKQILFSVFSVSQNLLNIRFDFAQILNFLCKFFILKNISFNAKCYKILSFTQCATRSSEIGFWPLALKNIKIPKPDLWSILRGLIVIKADLEPNFETFQPLLRPEKLSVTLFIIEYNSD